jgi:hypothetical protein
MSTLHFPQFVIPMLWHNSKSNFNILQFLLGNHKSSVVYLFNFLQWLSKKKKFYLIAFHIFYKYFPWEYIVQISIVQISY